MVAAPIGLASEAALHGLRPSRLSSECHYPIRFPGLSIVARERLFKTTRIRLDGVETVAHKDDFFPEFFLVVELALTVDELANHRLSHDSVSAIRPVQAPLMRFGVVKT